MLVLCLILQLFPFICVLAAIDSLKHYEVIQSPHISKKVVKRSVSSNSDIDPTVHEISFKALDRHFRLLVNPIEHNNLFTRSFSVVEDNGTAGKRSVSVDTSSFLEGTVMGEPHSDVLAHFDADGSLVASVHLNTSHHISIEPAWRHLNDTSPGSSIVYASHDVIRDDDERQFGRSAMKACAGLVGPSEKDHSDFDSDEQQFWRLLGVQHPSLRDVSASRRHERSATMPIAPVKSRCALKLVADTRFYEKFAASSTQIAVNYMINLIGTVNRIFLKTAFIMKGNILYEGFGLLIDQIIVKTEYYQNCNTNDDCSKYFINYNQEKLPEDGWRSYDLLHLFSVEEGEDFNTPSHICLAHLFTHHVLENGVLGLGWTPGVSDTLVTAGGICSPKMNINASMLSPRIPLGSKARTGDIFPNTAFSSSQNRRGEVVVTQEATLVTAHELGHNWGSLHDDDNNNPDPKTPCTPPFGDGGKYLMYMYSVSGYEHNNDKFSRCSRTSIGKVLDRKMQHCFQEVGTSFCGNFKVESGEECDNGYLGNAAENVGGGSCCDAHCSFTSGSTCNPLNHGCCNATTCSPVVNTTTTMKCRGNGLGECVVAAACNGNDIECPPPIHKSNGTECGDQGHCFAGECKSICFDNGLEQCLCDEVENRCKFCCKTSNKTKCEPYRNDSITYCAHEERSLNESCHVFMRENAVCMEGFCQKNGNDNRMRCVYREKDYLAKYWSFFSRLNASLFVKFMYDNLVGSVVFISLLIWIPVSCFVDRVDRRVIAELEQDEEDAYKRQFSCDIDRVVRVEGMKYADGTSRYSDAVLI